MSIEFRVNKIPDNLNQKSSEVRQSEGYPSKTETLLHIFRHGKKAGGNDVSQEEDLVMPLKPEGKIESIERGKDMERIPDSWSLAVGSPRQRAQETAAFTRGAMYPDLTGEESLEEIQERLGETAPGQKVWVDKRLDMPFVKGETPEFDVLLESANRGEYLTKSYELYEAAGENGNSTTYGRQVHNIASLILRQAEINKKLAERREYENTSDNIPVKASESSSEKPASSETPKAVERFMGTHGGISESFLSEFIRRTKGDEEAARFRELFKPGFSYNEGMDVRIVSGNDAQGDAPKGEPGDEPTVRITVHATSSEGPYVFDETVPVSVIRSITEDFS